MNKLQLFCELIQQVDTWFGKWV